MKTNEIDQEFINQIEDPKIRSVHSVIIEWKNTEDGLDKTSAYYRKHVGNQVIYENVFNENLWIMPDNPFWKTLEEIYQSVLKETYGSQFKEFGHSMSSNPPE